MERKHLELPPERIAAALRGDRAAFAELYRCYAPRVRASVATAIRFRAELGPHFDDILGEVWARFLANGCRQLRSYDASRGAFGYYIRMRAWALARMLAAQVLRRVYMMESDDPFVSLFGEDGLEGQILGRDELEKLQAAVQARLDPVDQALFERVLVEGRKIDEVIGALGISKDTAYRRSHRLRAKLQRMLAELGQDAGHGGPPVAMLLAFAAIAERVSDFPFGAP